MGIGYWSLIHRPTVVLYLSYHPATRLFDENSEMSGVIGNHRCHNFPMTQLQHSSESQSSAEPWHSHKVENPSPLYILFIVINETHQSDSNLAGNHVSEEELRKIKYTCTTTLHNEDRKSGPAKNYQINWVRIRALFNSFPSFLAKSHNLENKLYCKVKLHSRI